MSCDRLPVTRGRSVAKYPLLHGPLQVAKCLRGVRVKDCTWAPPTVCNHVGFATGRGGDAPDLDSPSQPATPLAASVEVFFVGSRSLFRWPARAFAYTGIQFRPLLSGLPTPGGGVPFCQFWVGLVGLLFKISFFPTRKVFKILGGWVSEITPPLPVGKQRPDTIIQMSPRISNKHPKASKK